MGIVKDKSLSVEAAELRRQAEERLQAKTAEVQPPRTVEETQRLVHELEVHQIELEMQNAELLQARDEVEAVLEKYTDLYDFAPVGYYTLDRDGVIREVNITGALLLGIERSRLIGRPFTFHVSRENRHVFAAFLGNIFEIKGKDSLEVALTKEGKQPLYVQIEALSCESGQKCRFAAIDITARKHLEDELHRLNEVLETRIKERTAELEAKNAELERTIRLFINRELRMVELKEKLAQHEKKVEEAT